MYSSTQQPSVLLLPRLKAASDIQAKTEAGEWDSQSERAFVNLANSLDYDAPGTVKNISSVPTLWARPLTFEMVLFDQNNPLRPQMIEQWQGMLAAIALAEMRGFPLKAQLIELGELKGKEEFASSLFKLRPEYGGRNLYTLANKHPWEDIYVFLWAGKPVGMTSPSTLVVPSEDGNWGDLKWWNKQEKRLLSPISSLNVKEQALLWGWLKNLNDTLNPEQGDRNAVNVMKGLIGEFQKSLQQDPEIPLSLSDDEHFFGEPINRGVLSAINRPIKAPEQPSCVCLVPSRSKIGEAPPLLIIDDTIAKAWNVPAQNIWIHRGKTLASLKVEDLKSGRLIWENVRWIESKNLFLPDFKFIDAENALPGMLIPASSEPLAFNGQKITPLIPLNSILLDYLTPEDLVKKVVKFQPIKGPQGSQIRVILDLPLTGTLPDQPSQTLRLFKDYPLTEENALREVPILDIWPNFQAPGWQEYYAFYYDAAFGEATFQVHLPQAKLPKIFQEGRGTFQMARLEQFPAFVECQDTDRRPIGLILLPTPETISPLPEGTWKVGVDFGTSFNNIYVNQGGTVSPLVIENLLLRITAAKEDTRTPVLREYFILDDFVPKEKPLPLSSVLTNRGSKESEEDRQNPLFDGRFYNPDSSRTFKPQEDWIKTDLKWGKTMRRYSKLFLRHLALHISALAAKRGVNQIQWNVSYPSAFSRNDRNLYAKAWKDITKELDPKTGIKHIAPDSDNFDQFRTESLAIAQYFADREGRNLVNSTCIDMGGGTSDISIWEENKLVHQCSVLLAGRDLFSQFLKMNPKFLAERFNASITDWKNLESSAFNAKLDVLLRLESEKWLDSKRADLADEGDFQGLLQLMAIGTAGLYYYVGILLKVLHEPNAAGDRKYNKPEITRVYIGGNASRFLNWLDDRGSFDSGSEMNEVFSRMLSRGSGFEDTEEITCLSENPKHEAACGLVLSGSKLEGLKKKEKDPPIAGEACVINSQEVSWDSHLDFEEDIKDFSVPTLVKLPEFLYEFHIALRELDIEGITALNGYTRSSKIEDNAQLWRDTQKELTNILLKVKDQGKSDDIRVEPPFILGLKALLMVLGQKWADKFK